MELCIGLFGTCGKSTWRKGFIEAYESHEPSITYFNPQVDDWDPSCAVEEARHMASDAVICFPVLAETLAGGSLAETGFSIMQAIRLDDRRDIIILIEPTVSQALQESDPVAAKESCRARALVREHLLKLRLRNVFVVDTMEQMRDMSIELYEAAARRERFFPFTTVAKARERE